MPTWDRGSISSIKPTGWVNKQYYTSIVGDNKLAEEMNVRDISECEISIKANYTYTGKQIKPEPVITCEDRTLEKGTDYTLSYGTNKAIGKGKVIVAGAGDFGGTTELSFSIVPKGTTISGVTAGKKKLTVKWKKQTSQATGYKIQYSTNSDFSNAKTITIKKKHNCQESNQEPVGQEELLCQNMHIQGLLQI